MKEAVLYGPRDVRFEEREEPKIVDGRYSSAEVHRALFRKGPPKPRTLEELRAGVRRYQKKRRAVR